MKHTVELLNEKMSHRELIGRRQWRRIIFNRKMYAFRTRLRFFVRRNRIFLIIIAVYTAMRIIFSFHIINL